MSDRPSARDRLADMGRRLRTANSSEGAVTAARAVRRAAPGGIDPLANRPASHPSDRLARLLAEASAERPSAVRELGLAGVQLWQSLARRKELSRDGAEVAIVFTDLVGFSKWALQAGDDQVLQLLRDVNRTSERAINRCGGQLVKYLGDGLMAVFTDTAAAIEACHEMCRSVGALSLDGFRPQLRAGVHTGHPRVVGRDYLGVDVNVAARVAAAASGGEVLVSGPALDRVEPDRYPVRKYRKFRAKGVPADLEVFLVGPR